MSKKKYLFLVAIFALLVFAVALVFQNDWWTFGVILLGVVGLQFIRFKSNAVISDERTYHIAEKSSRMAFISYCVLGGVGSVILSLIQTSERVQIIVTTLAISVSVILGLYIIFYFYFSRNM